MPRIFRQDARHAANAIATLLDFGTIRIENTIACRVHRIFGFAYPHQLIKTGAGCFITELTQRRNCRWWKLILTLIDDENFVPGAVHF
jgi:hypothetical protein